MELSPAEQKLLKRHTKFGEWSERHPFLSKALPWLILLLTGLYLLLCGGGATIMTESMDLGQERGLYFGEALVPGPGGSAEQTFIQVLMITGFYAGLCAASLGAVSAIFSLILFLSVRASFRDRALIFKLHRRVQELEVGGKA